MPIDVHAHVLPADYPADSPACFPSMEPIDGDTAKTLVFGQLRFKAQAAFFAAEARVEAMEANGVDVEVLSPMPPLLNYELDAADGLSLSRAVNDAIGNLCANVPDRMLGMGMVPLQDPELACAELAAVADAGLMGVEIASHVNGTSLADPSLAPFFDEVARQGLCIFVHAVRGAFGDRLPASAGPSYAVGVEAGLAAAAIVTSGALERNPDLRISVGHGAGGFPMVIPRAHYFWSGSWDEGPRRPERFDMSPDSPAPYELARKLFYDALVFDPRTLRYLIDLLGHDRLLLGSDFPAMPRQQPLAGPVLALDLSPEVTEDLVWRNAWRFLGRPVPPHPSATA